MLVYWVHLEFAFGIAAKPFKDRLGWLLWLGGFVWQLGGRAILSIHDPQFDEALGGIIEGGRKEPRTAH